MSVYCEGNNCSKKDTCKKHIYIDDESREYIDYSMQGHGECINTHCEVKYDCGNLGDFKLYENVYNESPSPSKEIHTKIVHKKDEISHDDYSLIQCANCHSHGIEITLDENDYLNLKCKWCGVSSTLKIKENNSIFKYKNMWTKLVHEINKLKDNYHRHDNYRSALENVYGETICKKILSIMDTIKKK